MDLDLPIHNWYSLPSNVEPVESLQHNLYQFVKQNYDNYFRGAYFVSQQGDIVSMIL